MRLLFPSIFCLLYLSLVCGEKAAKDRHAFSIFKYKRDDGVTTALTNIENRLAVIEKKLDACQSSGTGLNCLQVPKNCYEAFKCGGATSGVYSVDPDGQGAFKVYCDQKTSGGGWLVFQRRQDGSVDFYKGWADYKHGFGNLNGEFWLGLDKIHRLTAGAAQPIRYKLRVDLQDTMGQSKFAEYVYFAVSAEQSKYQLSLGTYSGNAGDSLSAHRGADFSTKDRDNDQISGNCATQYKGAWWYTSCHESNLNGVYHHGQHASFADGINWFAWKGYYYSAKRAEMKIRPQQATLTPHK